jgi:hypothetical protein
MRLWKPDASQREIYAALNVYHFPYEWAPDTGLLDGLIDGMFVAALSAEISILDIAAKLKSKEVSDRVFAARTLMRFGPQAIDAVPELIDALADEKLGVRKAVEKTWGQLVPLQKQQSQN